MVKRLQRPCALRLAASTQHPADTARQRMKSRQRPSQKSSSDQVPSWLPSYTKVVRTSSSEGKKTDLEARTALAVHDIEEWMWRRNDRNPSVLLPA